MIELWKSTKIRIQVLAISCTLLIIIASTSSAYSKTGSDSYQIPKFWDESINYVYFQQVTNNACGPACVQMVLGFFNVTPLPDQVTLASEMNTTVYESTYTSYVSKPFIIRNIGIIFDGDLSDNFSDALLQLEGNVSLNRPAILLMWYDSSNQTGHYRVVTGYNQNGLFFHDPDTVNGGPNVFFNNALVEKLWTSYDHWALILKSGEPYTPQPNENFILPIVFSFIIIMLVAIVLLSFLKTKHDREYAP
jgi:ABC-type bacteriocin/lantibiotic exporter with double-glycine peptidase domain